MKLVNHEPIIGISKCSTCLLSILLSSIFFYIMSVINPTICFVHICIFSLGALFLTMAIMIVAIPKDIYDWPICSKILAHCGLISYISIWDIIKDGDYISFSNIKHDGTSDDPITMNTLFWGIQHKGKYHIQIKTGDGEVIGFLPYEFTQRIASLMREYNTIMINGKLVYSKKESVMPKTHWYVM